MKTETYSFRNVVFSSYLTFRAMDSIANPIFLPDVSHSPNSHKARFYISVTGIEWHATLSYCHMVQKDGSVAWWLV
jgi:hypothetical protein